MDILATGPSIAQKPYPMPFKCQKLINEVLLLESLWATIVHVITVPKKPAPVNPEKQQLP